MLGSLTSFARGQMLGSKSTPEIIAHVDPNIPLANDPNIPLAFDLFWCGTEPCTTYGPEYLPNFVICFATTMDGFIFLSSTH